MPNGQQADPEGVETAAGRRQGSAGAQPVHSNRPLNAWPHPNRKQACTPCRRGTHRPRLTNTAGADLRWCDHLDVHPTLHARAGHARGRCQECRPSGRPTDLTLAMAIPPQKLCGRPLQSAAAQRQAGLCRVSSRRRVKLMFAAAGPAAGSQLWCASDCTSCQGLMRHRPGRGRRRRHCRAIGHLRTTPGLVAGRGRQPRRAGSPRFAGDRVLAELPDSELNTRRWPQGLCTRPGCPPAHNCTFTSLVADQCARLIR